MNEQFGLPSKSLAKLFLASIQESAWQASGATFGREHAVPATSSIAANSPFNTALPRADLAGVYMGRGDRRTKKGKRKAGSFGNCRPRTQRQRMKKKARDEAYEARNAEGVPLWEAIEAGEADIEDYEGNGYARLARVVGIELGSWALETGQDIDDLSDDGEGDSEEDFDEEGEFAEDADEEGEFEEEGEVVEDVEEEGDPE